MSNLGDTNKKGKPETYLTIHADGRITVGDKLKPDETAARVLECMKTQFLGDAQATKIRELHDRIKRLEAGDAALNYSIGLDLQKENDALKSRIKRLEEELMDMKNKHAVLVADVALYEDKAERIKRLEEALRRIANTDYRGNRSTESQIAAEALKEDKL